MSVNPCQILIYTAVSAAPIAWLLSKAVPRVFLEKCNLGRTNFEGKQVPTACGVVLLVAVLPTLACAVVSHPHRPEAVLFAFAAPAFALLGLVDDIWGDRSAGGFKGHLKSLLAGKITTGVIKALFGGAAALGCGFALAFRKGALSSTHGLIERQSLLQNSVEAVLTAALIALCANGLNLLDTRTIQGRKHIHALFCYTPCVVSRTASGGDFICTALGGGCLPSCGAPPRMHDGRHRRQYAWGGFGASCGADIGDVAEGGCVGRIGVVAPVQRKPLAVCRNRGKANLEPTR
jgi:UDP-N-acetylmuramyl pentapeptide phosphotransferase/UDP-N-acetylglucosamine-1-phosphate transferase